MLALLTLLVSGVLFATLSQSESLSIRANAGCTFHLRTLNGSSTSYPVGQLGNGQAKAGSGMPASVFTWFGDDFVDQQGRGCWWTPPSTVLQCDSNQQPDHGFKIGCDGSVQYNGQSTFWECRTGESDQVNIYLKQTGGECDAIALIADGCAAACSSPGGPQSATTGPGGAGGAGPGGSTPTVPGGVSTTTGQSTGPNNGGGVAPNPTSNPQSPSPTIPGQSTGPNNGGGVAPNPTSNPSPTNGNGSSSPMIPGGGSNPSQSTGPNNGGGVAPNPTSNPAGSGGNNPTPSNPNGGPSISPFTTRPTDTEPPGMTSSSPSGAGAAGPRPTAPALPPAPKDCSSDLNGPFEYPHLLVPVDKANPDKSYGSSLYGQVSENATTIFNFDIPASAAGQSCKAIFAFPTLQQLQTSSYYFEGDGSVAFARLGDAATLYTTYNDAVAMGALGHGQAEWELGQLKLSPGNTYVLETFDCVALAGKQVAYVMREPDGKDTCLVYFQDWNPSPIGLFIRKC